ncbi:MAG TPA: hypothetical protein VGW39_15140 [Chthoniobacterales bacterium]|nr:hypothetical protein [Chthoniobacterales bacterium]
MRPKKFLLFFAGSVIIAGILSVCLAPLLVAGGLRLWVARVARQEGLRIEFGKIEAPLLRPVIVHGLQITSHPEAPFHVKVESPRVEFALNLGSIFNWSRGRLLKTLTTDGITVDIRRNPQPTTRRFAWRTLDDLLPDNFKLAGVQLHVENGDTIFDLLNGTLSGTQIEAGVFSASEITIVSPWFRKGFSQLRGTTSWQDTRLNIGALTLTRGLDLDAISIDLSQIGERRIGLELNVDAFGGKIRARVSSDDQEDKRTWDAAGTASGISLSQMSDALDLTDRAGGSLRACKFTFRGESTNLREATATVWAEVTGLTWRDRTADTIMIGASLYNRQVHVEQLFVKQRDNQFNLSGESALPQKWSDWLNPDFHGEIVASINDLGDFARLFGASASDFAGKIEIAGNVNAQERKLAGHLSVSGTSLTLFRAPFESLKVELNLKESRLEIAQFELRREEDSFLCQASLDLGKDRGYSFTFTNSIADIADYGDLIPEPLRSLKLSGSLELNWTGNGTEATHSGTFHARGHGLHPLESPVVPFDAEFEGDYSPDNIFFRQFNLSNQHAAFSAFVTIARDYLQLQTLRLDLNGKPRLQGNIFLPVSFSKLHTQGNWLAALSDDPNFDLDLTLDPTDLAELAAALTTQPKMSGQMSGSLEIHGTPASLQGNSIAHLRDFVFQHEPRISAELETQVSLGILSGKASVVAPGSNPVNLEASIPYQFEKTESAYTLNNGGPFSATLSFPAVLMSKLPRYFSRGVFLDGVLSGHLVFSNSLRHPDLLGNVHLINGRFFGGLALSAGVTFGRQKAAIDFAQLTKNNVRYGARGEVDFRELSDMAAKIFPNAPMVLLAPLDADDCVDGIELWPGGVGGSRRERITEVEIRGSLFSPDWTISLSEHRPDDPLETLLQGGSSRTFSFCRDGQPTGKTLTLGLARPPFP